MCQFDVTGYDGTNWLTTGRMRWFANSSGVVAGTIPTRADFYVMNASASLTQAWVIDQNADFFTRAHHPLTTATYDLGLTGLRWKDGWFSRNIGVGALITEYNGIATVANGVPAEYAQVNLTAQTAAITTTTLYAVPASGAGQYRVSWNAKVTTVDAVSSTLGALTIVYTDPDGIAQTITAPASVAAGTIATSSAGNTTTTVLLGMPLLLNCKLSTNITYAMAYVSNTPGSMAYNLHIILEKQ